MTHLVTVNGLPIQWACRAVGLGRATYYRPRVDWVGRDAPVIAALTTLVAAKSRWGFRKCYDRLRLNGHPWNHKRLWRVYCQLRLNLPRRTKKRLPVRVRQPLTVLPQPNAVWAVDFMSDTLYGGRRFRTLNVLDEGVREGLAIEIDTSLLQHSDQPLGGQVVTWWGEPQAIRLDNGPELLADRFITWCADRGIELRYIQPGILLRLARIERFNRTYRTKVLNAYVFESLDQVREISAEWLQSYNEKRPHDALAGVPPAVYRSGGISGFQVRCKFPCQRDLSILEYVLRRASEFQSSVASTASPPYKRWHPRRNMPAEFLHVADFEPGWGHHLFQPPVLVRSKHSTSKR